MTISGLRNSNSRIALSKSAVSSSKYSAIRLNPEILALDEYFFAPKVIFKEPKFSIFYTELRYYFGRVNMIPIWLPLFIATVSAFKADIDTV